MQIEIPIDLNTPITGGAVLETMTIFIVGVLVMMPFVWWRLKKYAEKLEKK